MQVPNYRGKKIAKVDTYQDFFASRQLDRTIPDDSSFRYGVNRGIKWHCKKALKTTFTFKELNMAWKGIALGTLILGTAVMSVSLRATAGEDSKPVTFTKDVLPILQKNCQTCHRPGEIAPMSFLTYKDTRPWAKAMKEAVVSRQMPPWFADPNYGHFANDRTLSDATIKTLVAWADGGDLEGDAKDAPAPVHFVEGWSIKPDMVIEMPQDIHLPAT